MLEKLELLEISNLKCLLSVRPFDNTICCVVPAIPNGALVGDVRPFQYTVRRMRKKSWKLRRVVCCVPILRLFDGSNVDEFDACVHFVR